MIFNRNDNMRKTAITITTLCILLYATACNDRYELPEGQRIYMQAGNSQGSEELLEDGDRLGLYAFKNSDTPENNFMGVREMDNLMVTIKNGQIQGESPLYFPKYEDNTDFYLYYPYEETSVETGQIYQSVITYNDQSDDNYFRRSDKMVAVNLDVKKAPEPVVFRLKRLMSRIDFKLVPGEGYGSISELKNSGIILKNIRNNTSLDMISQILLEPDTPNDIVPHGRFTENNAENCVEGVSAIIVPQKFDKGKVLFTVQAGDKKFNGTLDKEMQFEAGKQYCLTMTLNKSINGESITVDATIKDWTEGLEINSGIVEVDPDDDISYVMDIDGNEYDIIQIGAQKWLAGNLKTTRFNDGTPIENIPAQFDWDDAGSVEKPAFCYYDNNSDNKDKYGILYNWHVANSGKICPEGWRVPDSDDFNTLITTLGENAGTKIKSTDPWYDLTGTTKPEYSGTNESGFNAVASGSRCYQSGFERLDMYGEWWTTDVNEVYSYSAYSYLVYAKYNDIRSAYHPKEYGLAIRCIKD